MENDADLTKFHGILLSLSNRGLLHKPPDEIEKKEVKELLGFVSSLSRLARHKAAYYMILNTELKVSDDLKNDEFVGLFVNITPAIPLHCLIKWIYVLNLFDEFCEAIKNLPSVLGEELVCEVVANKTIFQFDSYLTLWCSVFKKMCKIERNNFSESPNELIHCFDCISVMVQDGLVNEQTINAFSEFLHRVLELVIYYKNPELDDKLYKLSITLKASDNVFNKKCTYYLFRIISSLSRILSFDTLEQEVSQWRRVRILSGRLLNEAKHLEIPDDVLGLLSKLGLDERDLEIESLISDARAGKKFDWTRSIINPVRAVQVDSPLDKMNNDNLDVLLCKLFKCLNDSNEEMKELFLAAVALSQNQYKWLERVFAQYRPNLLITSNTDKDLTEIFNRISMTETIPLKMIVPLCMQCPVETVKKLCQLVISSKASRSLQVFHELKPVCQAALPTGASILVHVIMCFLSEELSSLEENSFCRWVVELRNNNLVDCNLFENLIERLKEFLEEDKMNKAVLCLTIMDSILIEMEPKKNFAFLVFISQVLGYFSWDLTTFSTTKANGRDIVCSIVRQLMARLDCGTHYEILDRIRQEILKCWEVNQACFCDLWFSFGEVWHGSGKFDSLILALIHSSSSRYHLGQFLLSFSPPQEMRSSIVLALTKVLPVLTLNKWSKALTELTGVWKEIDASASGCQVLDMFVTVWYLLTLLLNKNKDILACYKHCMTGFTRLLSSSRLKGESLVLIYEKIHFIMKSIEDEEIRKSCYVVLLPVLKDRLESARDEDSKAHLKRIDEILKEKFKQ